MKTFKQWFNSLSKETQEYLRDNCRWIDTTSKDYYRHPKLDESALTAYPKHVEDELTTNTYFHNNNDRDLYITMFLKHKDDLPHDDYIKALVGLIDSDKDISTKVDALDLREVYKLRGKYKETYERTSQSWSHSPKPNYKYKYSLSHFLLVTEDFNNIDWSVLDKDSLSLNAQVVEILGHDEVKKIAKENPQRMTERIARGDLNNPVFDELFFCKDGWTKKQKQDIINNYRYTEDDVKTFMAKIVAVDESYLRYVGTYFIENYPALGMHLYKMRKSDEEIAALPEKHRIEEEYQYPKEYRKLFQIAACCARGNVGKAMAGTIGDAACILKMYGYNFNQIFDCLYPQYAETTETEEAEATTV